MERILTKTLLIILIFISCSNNDTFASETQRNWCISEIKNIQRAVDTDPTDLKQSILSFSDAIEIFQNDFKKEVQYPEGYSMVDALYEHTEESLQLCKIWSDINEID